MNSKYAWFSVIAVVGVLLDQVTKFWIRANIEYRSVGITVIDGFFDIVHAQNPGAALGLLGNVPGRRYLFVFFTLFAAGVIINMMRELRANERFMPLVLGMILSGAIGNAIDRIINDGGRVTDFLRFHSDGAPGLKAWLASHWPYMTEYPSFNVADIALVVGVGLFIVHYLFLEEKDDAKNDAPKPDDSASS